MKGSRIAAVGIAAAATLWIASGTFFPHEGAESKAAVRPTDSAETLFRVAVATVSPTAHSQKLTLSGRTEADRKVMATARTGGIVTELKVRRGSVVKEGDVIAILSDEARIAQVAQAKALLTQRKLELDAKRGLIERGSMPRLELGNLEAQYKAAEASVAIAEAERDRGVVRAPWSGVVNDVPIELGQAAFSMQGKEIAQIISLDPIVAVVEVAERKLGGVRLGSTAEVRLVSGQTVSGKVRFVSKMASPTTRTYRVEVEIPNPDAQIPDGITAEVSLPLAEAKASRLPRSALTFSSAGDLGVRVIGPNDTVAFAPVTLVEDEQSHMWVTGLKDSTRVIVQGQDFVREGQRVAVMPATPDTKTEANAAGPRPN